MVGKFIILIGGYLAAGKTTFSRQLSKELGVLCVNKDYVKEALCDGLGFNNRAQNKKMSEATLDVMLHLAMQSMRVGLPIILESNFRKADGERIVPLLEQYDYKPIEVFFEGDLKVLFERFIRRLTNRHPAHTAVDVTWDEYVRHSNELREFGIGSERITVDTTSVKNVDYCTIITQIKQLINGGNTNE